MAISEHDAFPSTLESTIAAMVQVSICKSIDWSLEPELRSTQLAKSGKSVFSSVHGKAIVGFSGPKLYLTNCLVFKSKLYLTNYLVFESRLY